MHANMLQLTAFRPLYLYTVNMKTTCVNNDNNNNNNNRGATFQFGFAA